MHFLPLLSGGSTSALPLVVGAADGVKFAGTCPPSTLQTGPGARAGAGAHQPPSWGCGRPVVLRAADEVGDVRSSELSGSGRRAASGVGSLAQATMEVGAPGQPAGISRWPRGSLACLAWPSESCAPLKDIIPVSVYLCRI